MGIRQWPKPWASDTDLSHGRGSCRQRGTCWTPCWNSSSCPHGILHSKQMQRRHFNIIQHSTKNETTYNICTVPYSYILVPYENPLSSLTALNAEHMFLSSVGVFFKCGRFCAVCTWTLQLRLQLGKDLLITTNEANFCARLGLGTSRQRLSCSGVAKYTMFCTAVWPQSHTPTATPQNLSPTSF